MNPSLSQMLQTKKLEFEQFNKIKECLENNYLSNMENAFIIACYYGHLDVAQLIYQMKPTIYISAYNEQAFRYACEKGHLELAKWLVSIKPDIDITANNDQAFRESCEEGHVTTAQWLESLFPENYHIEFVDGKMDSYKITKIFNIYQK